jgi:hypothetical protein
MGLVILSKYSSPIVTSVIKSRKMRWAGNIARIGDMRNAYKISVGRLEGKRQFGRPCLGSENNIRMDLREIE